MGAEVCIWWEMANAENIGAATEKNAWQVSNNYSINTDLNL
jgi:hypothetical protein